MPPRRDIQTPGATSEAREVPRASWQELTPLAKPSYLFYCLEWNGVTNIQCIMRASQINQCPLKFPVGWHMIDQW